MERWRDGERERDIHATRDPEEPDEDKPTLTNMTIFSRKSWLC